MNWFAQKRQAWIAESLNIYGFINRQHLMKKFDISTALAARDLGAFKKQNPKLMKYDTKLKRYVSQTLPSTKHKKE